MKGGSEYAKGIKRLHNQLIRQFGKPAPTEPTDPIEQLVIGILSACMPPAKAIATYQKLRQIMVDLNEMRVTPATELAKLIGNSVPMAFDKAQRIVNALNEIRRRQDSLDLSFLKQRGRREAREYLESLDGVGRSAAASVVLHSLGGHAIPVDDLTLYILRKEGRVTATANAVEAQAFLERHISAADAQTFVALLSRYVASRASRVPIEKLSVLLSPPKAEESKQDHGPATEPEQAASKGKTFEKTPAKKGHGAESAAATQSPAAKQKGKTQAPHDKAKPKHVSSKQTPSKGEKKKMKGPAKGPAKKAGSGGKHK